MISIQINQYELVHFLMGKGQSKCNFDVKCIAIYRDTNKFPFTFKALVIKLLKVENHLFCLSLNEKSLFFGVVQLLNHFICFDQIDINAFPNM